MGIVWVPKLESGNKLGEYPAIIAASRICKPLFCRVNQPMDCLCGEFSHHLDGNQTRGTLCTQRLARRTFGGTARALLDPSRHISMRLLLIRPVKLVPSFNRRWASIHTLRVCCECCELLHNYLQTCQFHALGTNGLAYKPHDDDA